jgi:restriction endonuclease Mrr
MKKYLYQVLGTTISISILALFLFGCMYKSYAGRYWIGKASLSFVPKPATEEQNKEIEEVVRSTAKDFGFVEDERLSWMDENVITFGKREQIKSKYDSLNGANLGITLLFEKGPRPTVGIKDYAHSYETEFIKALKSELEYRLSKVIDMRGVEFKRHWDLMD